MQEKLEQIKELLSQAEMLINEVREEHGDINRVAEAHRNVSEALTLLGRD